MDDYYELLEIDPGADETAIKEAVKKQRRLWISRASSAPELDRRQAAERMVELIEVAERELLDPTRRAAYDRQRAARPPEDRAEAATEDPQAWAARAAASMRDGNPHLALHEIEQALRLDHLQPQFHAIRGEAFSAVGAWANGLIAYRTAHELDRHNPTYQLLLGQQLLRGERYAEALPILDSALAVGGATSQARVLVGLALHGLADQAADHLTDGTPVIIHPQQAYDVAQLSGRALSLSPPDQQLTHRLQHLHSLALAATQRVFDGKRLLSGLGSALSTSASMGCGCLLMVLGMFAAFLFIIGAALGGDGASMPLGFLLLVGTGAGIAALCYRPRWQVTERDTRSYRVSRTS
ncbi:hypothetical protein AB0C28_51660 [Nonomuraea sp. NPDC048892]|uniref:J domain-containing protein n=1 Tax=Nonomuraea sp. NPDC048892 TaxID=3154624 RepID=UPI0033C41E8F